MLSPRPLKRLSRSFIDFGIIASANSDYGGGPWHGNPITGIYSMVTRKTEGGDTVGPDQAVSIMDSIKAYTYNGAYVAFDEDKLASIEPGKLADLVILNDDILSVPHEEIMSLKVIRTIMDGKTVYEK